MKKWHSLFTGQFGYPQPAKGMGYLDLTYDGITSCTKCGIGFKQKDAFRLSQPPKQKHSQFFGLNWVFDQIFVRQSVFDKLSALAVPGVSFSQPLIYKKDKPVDGVFQVHVDSFLKEGPLTDGLSFERCEYPRDEADLAIIRKHNPGFLDGSFCGQTKYHFPQGQPFRFAAKAFESVSDIVRCSTWFGSGGAASQPIFVSDEIKQLIDREKWRGAFLSEVEVV